MSKIKIIPLGGLEQIGKNMTLVEVNEDIYVVDVGLAFPDESMLGVDYIVPNFQYLRENKDRLKRLFITHAHEDHIGGLKQFMKEFDVKIHTTELTAEIIKNKNRFSNKHFVIVDHETVIEDENCDISFFITNHSIPDSIGIVFETDQGQIVHTGDFKMDYSPSDGRHIDFQRMAEIAKKGVIALLSDSTNAEKEGVSISENQVKKSLESVIKGHDGRIIIATFSSSLYRVPSIFEIAKKTGKKVFVSGSGMEKNIQACLRLRKWADLNLEEVLVSREEYQEVDPNKLIVITTGAQGEFTGGLFRLSSGEHKDIKLKKSDLVILSSSAIPGNEKYINVVVNEIMKKGAKVRQGRDIHTSGHGHQEEQKLMIRMFKPKYFIPVHGEFKMLVKHKELAVEVGIKEENVLVCQNGDVIEFENKVGRKNGRVKATPVYIDYSGLGTVNIGLLKQRRRMAIHGVGFVHIQTKKMKENQVDEKNNIKVHVILKGIAASYQKELLHSEIEEVVMREIGLVKSIRELKNAIKEPIEEIIFKHVKRKPDLELIVD